MDGLSVEASTDEDYVMEEWRKYLNDQAGRCGRNMLKSRRVWQVGLIAEAW